MKFKMQFNYLIPLGVFIIILFFTLACGGQSGASNTTTEEPEVKEKESVQQEEAEVEKEQKEEIAEEPEDKFSFAEYIVESEVIEYKMVEEEDISTIALGDKKFSEYTEEELERLPLNYRMKYSITIPRDTTEEELKSTMAQIIKDKSTQDPDIDEIVVFSWYFEESVGQGPAMGKAEWCPNGEWAGVPPEIAESNNRDSYKIVFDQIEIQIYEDEVKYGLTESERMQAFYDLVELQDSIPLDDPEYNKKNDESYITIADKYGITEDQMHDIATEGLVKDWPMPEL